jgi:hypothetical protein
MQSRKVGYTNGVIRNLIEEGQTIQCLKEKERKDKQWSLKIYTQTPQKNWCSGREAVAGPLVSSVMLLLLQTLITCLNGHL